MKDLKNTDKQESLICKTKDEIEDLIQKVQARKPQLSSESIIKGIKTCCILNNTDFTECVIEMASIHQLMKNK